MDGQRVSVQFADNAAHVSVKLQFDLRDDDRGLVFRADNEMRQKIGEGKGHWNLMFEEGWVSIASGIDETYGIFRPVNGACTNSLIIPTAHAVG